VIETAVKIVSGYLPQKSFKVNDSFKIRVQYDRANKQLVSHDYIDSPMGATVQVHQNGQIDRAAIVALKCKAQMDEASWTKGMNTAALWFALEVLRMADKLDEQYSIDYSGLDQNSHTQPEIKTAKAIEAHGTKGMNSKPWKKTFKSVEALDAWVEKNSATVEATRDVEE
jgi:hypothetical protein